MISDELKDFLIQVIKSWQVIAVTLVAILYIALVSYTARFRRRIGAPPPAKKTSKPNNDKQPAKTSGAANKKGKDKKNKSS
ncbi:MAG: hypothetical protein LBF87_05045 [Treponema sp.]|jgi:hypothetical protein|nr:hypothetical protein [Treponema sp.]